MSAPMDFFKVLKNIHPPNQALKRYERNYSGTGSDNDNKNLRPPNQPWKRYDRNYSGTGSDNDNKNLRPPNQPWKRYDRNYSGTGSDNDNISGMQVPRNADENIPVHHTSSWTNLNNLPKEEPPHLNSKSLNKFPNEPLFSSTHPPPPPPPPFAYNEVHPRTSAHFHQCPSCDYPLMVQVTADLFYHHVTFIPAAMAKRNNETYEVNNFVNGGRTQEYSPVQEPEEEEEVSTLSNKQAEVMETAPNEKPQQGFRTYACITAGNNFDSKDDDNPLEDTDDNADLMVGLGQVEIQVIDNDKAKENIAASQVVDKGGDGDDDASNDGFTTVVSWKSKLRAKAAAKAREAAAHGYGYGYGYGRGKNRFGKYGRGSTRGMMGPRDEQHNKDDGGPRDEHDKRVRGGLIRDGHDKHGRIGARDEHNKHGTGDQKEEGQDKHGRRGGARDEHNKHGIVGDQKEDGQNKHVRAPWDKREYYGGFPREMNDKYQRFPREEHTPQRERVQRRK